MIDRIYIPTLGRSNNQITYDGLPDFVKDITYLVIQPHEKKLHQDKKILVLPKSVKGIHNTRKWIYEKGKGTIWGMFDDDLVFQKRIGSKKTTMTKNDWKVMLKKTYSFLTTGTTFAGHRLSFFPPLPPETPYQENTGTHCAFYFNGNIVPDLDWSIPLAEDLHMVLQLLRKGFNNKVWNKYSVLNKAYRDGGCNTKGIRTIKKINDAHKKLIKFHPEFVKNDGFKDTKMGEMIKIRISWKKSFTPKSKSSLDKFLS